MKVEVCINVESSHQKYTPKAQLDHLLSGNHRNSQVLNNQSLITDCKNLIADY